MENVENKECRHEWKPTGGRLFWVEALWNIVGEVILWHVMEVIRCEKCRQRASRRVGYRRRG